MPRMARVIVPNCPHHIVQRGHNRSAVFVDDADYEYYLGNLFEVRRELGVKLYAYCLVTNHVHLVVEPIGATSVISEMMKRLAGRQTRYVNKLERRTGSLWEGRYRVSAIETNRYLLACCRYVDMNPVRAGMVICPENYRWSSYLLKLNEDWRHLDPDVCYMALAASAAGRRRAYEAYVQSAASEVELRSIARAVQRNQLTGSKRFAEEVECRMGLRVSCRDPGRPARKVGLGEEK